MVRPLWIVLFAIATFPFVMVFQRFERVSGRAPVAVPRLVLGCIGCCVGLALVAIGGINGGSPTSLNWVALAAVFGGATVAGFGPISAGLARLTKS